MLEVDVIYKLPNDLIPQYINGVIKKESIDLGIYCACWDYNVNKQVIRKALTRLTFDGKMYIRCFFENLSEIISVVTACNYSLRVLIIDDGTKDPYPVLFVSKINFCGSQVISKDPVVSALISPDSAQLVMLLGDKPTHEYVEKAKNLTNYVIGFTDNQLVLNRAKCLPVYIKDVL